MVLKGDLVFIRMQGKTTIPSHSVARHGRLAPTPWLYAQWSSMPAWKLQLQTWTHAVSRTFRQTIEQSTTMRLVALLSHNLGRLKKLVLTRLMVKRSPAQRLLHYLVIGAVVNTALLPNLELPFTMPHTTQLRTVVAATVVPAFRQPLEDFHISQDYYPHHPALDLAAPLGTPIYPIAQGKVQEAGMRWDGHGNTVVVDHGDGLMSLYAHIAKISVKKGDTVDKVTQLGTIGLTGFTSGPHLHIEVTDNGKPVNPKSFLPTIIPTQ